MADCIFCRIVKGEIPCDKVFENDKILAFRDLNPQAPVHVLIVPKEHYENVLECVAARNGRIDNLMEAAAHIAHELGVDQTGFRLLTNCGKESGQTVGHLHFHLLGGKQLSDHMA